MCMIVQQSMVRLSGLTLFLSIFANKILVMALHYPNPLSLSSLPPYLLIPFTLLPSFNVNLHTTFFCNQNHMNKKILMDYLLLSSSLFQTSLLSFIYLFKVEATYITLSFSTFDLVLE